MDPSQLPPSTPPASPPGAAQPPTPPTQAAADCAPPNAGAAAQPTPSFAPPAGPGFDRTRQALGLNATPPPYPNPAYPYQPAPAQPYANPPYANPYGYAQSPGGYAPPPTGYAPPPVFNPAYGYPPPPAYGGNPGGYASPPFAGGPGGAGDGGGASDGSFFNIGLFGESFFQHIDELRKRVWRCVLALIIAACIVSWYMQDLNYYVLLPMKSQVRQLVPAMMEKRKADREAADDATRAEFTQKIDLARTAHDLTAVEALEAQYATEMKWHEFDDKGREARIYQMGNIRTNGPAGPFSYLVDLILYASLLLAAPYWLWELWGFVSPALYRREKMAVAPIFLFGLVLFLAGALFAYAYVLPISFNYLMDLGVWLDIEPWYDLGDYFSFCFMVTACFGLCFELPLVCIMLGKLGFLSHRTLIKHWKWMVFSAFLIGGILTPPDVMSQVMMAAVLMVLYLISIVGVWIVYPRPKPEEISPEGP